jgi:hypothetical protein
MLILLRISLLKNQAMYQLLSTTTKGNSKDLNLGIEAFISPAGVRDYKIIDTLFTVLNK